MIVIDAVAILNNEQVTVIILIHKKKFLKLIIVRNSIRSPIQTVQTIVGLNPVNIFTCIYYIVNQITGQVILLVTDFKFLNLLSIINVQSVASADPHQSALILAKRCNRTVRHIFLISNLL